MAMEQQEEACTWARSTTQTHFPCDNCGLFPIVGTVFKCTRCVEFELCESCRDQMMSDERPRKLETGETHTSDHPMRQVEVPDELVEAKEAGPLGEVVESAVRRWQGETARAAKNGDANSAMLLAQMSYTGYGCQKDVARGETWAWRARNKGGRAMRGVYDRL